MANCLFIFTINFYTVFISSRHDITVYICTHYAETTNLHNDYLHNGKGPQKMGYDFYILKIEGHIKVRPIIINLFWERLRFRRWGYCGNLLYRPSTIVHLSWVIKAPLTVHSKRLVDPAVLGDDPWVTLVRSSQQNHC